MRRITIDLETTGFNPPESGIVEIAAVVFEDGHEVAHFHSLCNPGEAVMSRPGVDDALKVSGITREQIAAVSSCAEVRPLFMAFMVQWLPGATLHAFNVRFDSRFLASAPWNMLSGSWGLCIMELAMWEMGPAGALPTIRGGKYKWPKLDEAATFFAVMRTNGHRALSDARCAAQIHEEILRRQGK